MKHSKTIILLRKYLKGKASQEETARIEKWYASPDERPAVEPIDPLSIKEALHQRIRNELDKGAIVRPLYKTPFFRVAASIILLLGVVSYFLFFKHTAKERPIARVEIKKEIINDVPSPNSVHAVLTLANGQQIVLDSSRNGSLAIQGKVQVVKLANGQIAYSGDAGSPKEVQYNTLSVPSGSRIVRLVLADGSSITLNAASSLTYPTAFTGSSRTVSIAGEAYFEITKNAAIPFYVKHENISIKVLGTHFNVNTYNDEKNIKITLLEGSVNVSKDNSSKTLKPGQQANLDKEERIRVINDVDMEQVMAWKNGKFQFGEKADIESIMRQIARWYDVEVEYRGTVTQHFWGSISRDVNVSQVLNMLEKTGSVSFDIKGKKVVVMPK